MDINLVGNEVTQMTERTVKIILACKGMIYPSNEDMIDRIRSYMSDECNCPKEDYTEEVITKIVLEAMYDYIDTCDRPSIFLRQMYYWHWNKEASLLERVCTAFELVQVQGDGKYINGFKEEDFLFLYQ